VPTNLCRRCRSVALHEDHELCEPCAARPAGRSVTRRVRRELSRLRERRARPEVPPLPAARPRD
jgi:hypothetical protein